MVHKSGTLTNLELALFNAVALITMRYGLSNPEVAYTISRVGRFPVSTKEIAKYAGYGSKLTSYHYKLLNRLVQFGYLDTKWETTRIKNFSVAKAGWDWLGVQRTVEIEGENGQPLLINVETHVNEPYTDLESVPF